MRIEPAPSVASAIGTRPAATAVALPPLEPPLVRCGFQGLRVTPQVADSVKPQIASSGSVRLADHDRARLAQASHDLAVGPGRLVEAVGAVGGDVAGHVDAVLDRDRHAEQRPLLPRLQPRLGLLGFEQRLLGEDDAKGVQLRIEARDPVQAELHQLARGETSPARTISACLAAPAKAISALMAAKGIRPRPARARACRSRS